MNTKFHYKDLGNFFFGQINAKLSNFILESDILESRKLANQLLNTLDYYCQNSPPSKLRITISNEVIEYIREQDLIAK